ncbi:MAG TPA: hypothetical protein VFP26_12370 [Gemmatimonadaceae bacterium]|nr:hypothetical protein [Gemmatimonadaceae bacterium]
MRGKGINYDTGFLNRGSSTREPFDPEIVRGEMRIIREQLHCNAVRITGGDLNRLELAAKYAAAEGLEVWFCPFTNGLTQDELLDLLADCAERAERLRRAGASIVLVTGSELTMFTLGFLPGDTLEERLALIADPTRVRPLIAALRKNFNEFLVRVVDAVRARFGGKISYASLPFEGVDWSRFDIISTDAGYRTRETPAQFRDQIRAFVAQGRAMGKPVAITEFGCMTFRGAAALGGSELTLIEWDSDGKPARVKENLVRDENEQATYLRELLEVFDSEGVEYAFVYTFARYDLPHHSDAEKDFDLTSRGIVKVVDNASLARSGPYAGMPWQPKLAFNSLAEYGGATKSDAPNQR